VLASFLLVVAASALLWLVMVRALPSIPEDGWVLLLIAAGVVFIPAMVVTQLLGWALRRVRMLGTRVVVQLVVTSGLQLGVTGGVVFLGGYTAQGMAVILHGSVQRVWRMDFPLEPELRELAGIKPGEPPPVATDVPGPAPLHPVEAPVTDKEHEERIRKIVSNAPPGSIFRWTDAQGAIHITQTPPEPGARTVHVEEPNPAPVVKPARPETKG